MQEPKSILGRDSFSLQNTIYRSGNSGAVTEEYRVMEVTNYQTRSPVTDLANGCFRETSLEGHLSARHAELNTDAILFELLAQVN